MPPRVRLGRTHGRSNTPRHEIQAGADLSPTQPALRRSHKFTALTEFCKRLFILPITKAENLPRCLIEKSHRLLDRLCFHCPVIGAPGNNPFPAGRAENGSAANARAGSGLPASRRRNWRG